MPKLTPPAGAPCWFELSSTDPEAALSFYRGLFGWQPLHHDMGALGRYTFLRLATGTVGALCGMPPGSEGQPSSWGVYFATADMEATVRQAQALGGQLLFGPFDVPGQGRGAVIADPGGAVFSLWQPAPGADNDFVMFETHAVGWVELATRDQAAAKAFYGSLLGWEFPPSTNPTPSIEYQELSVGGERFGGMLQMTEAWGPMPAHWSLYIPVDDVDACLTQASALGGKICVPAFDAPGVGRLARLDDPTGAGLYVIKLNRASGGAA